MKNNACCDVLEKLPIQFFILLNDGPTKILPHLIGEDEHMYKVNYCPSCGKHIRSIQIPVYEEE